MTKRNIPKLSIAKKNNAKAGDTEVARIGDLVSKTAGFIGTWLEILTNNSSLDADEAARKELIVGNKHSMLDAVVDLGNIAIKLDECQNRKAFSQALINDEGEISTEDREIILRYINSLSAKEEV